MLNAFSNTIVSWYIELLILKSNIYGLVAFVILQPVMVNMARSQKIYSSCQVSIRVVSRRSFHFGVLLIQLVFKSLDLLQVPSTHLLRSMIVPCDFGITVIFNDGTITSAEGFSSKAHRSPCQSSRQPSHLSQRFQARLPSTGQQE